MLYQRVSSPEQAESLLYEAGSTYWDGNTLVFRDMYSWPNLDASYSEDRPYKLSPLFGVKGKAEHISSSRAIQTTLFDGIHVPLENSGLLVVVPLKRFSQVVTRASYAEVRYYPQKEIDFTAGEMCLMGAARAVYEVANGVNTEGHAERYNAMLDATDANWAKRNSH